MNEIMARNWQLRRDHRNSYHAYLQGQEQQQSMQTQLNGLSTYLGKLGLEKVHGYISSLQASLVIQKSHFDTLVQSVPPGARQLSQADRLQEVFRLPELLEHILQYLDIAELLCAQQVNRAWFDAIQRSPTIQHKLCLRPDWKSKFYLPFSDFNSPVPCLTSTIPKRLPQRRAKSRSRLRYIKRRTPSRLLSVLDAGPCKSICRIIGLPSNQN